MIYENCRRVLKACVDAGLIKTVPENVYGKDKDEIPSLSLQASFAYTGHMVSQRNTRKDGIHSL